MAAFELVAEHERALPFDADIDSNEEIMVAARPVISRLGADLDCTDISVLLSDERVRVVARRAPSLREAHELDALRLSPGFVWHVDIAGMNALGLASRDQAPVLIEAGDVRNEALAGASAASAPITDPRTGQLRGAVTLVCPSTANSLLLPVTRRAAHEIELRLLDGSSANERLLAERFLRARRRTRSPLVVVGDGALLMNAAASRVVSKSDRQEIWMSARRAIKVGSACTSPFTAADGADVVAAVEPIHDGEEIVGALLHLERCGHEPTLRRPSRTSGWESLTDAERALADLIGAGLTNKEAAARLFLSRHTIDTHLRHIFRKLGINSRVDLARLVASRAPRPTGSRTTA
jgi:DNA-binding CsgD family transcriptional regulator